MSQWLHDRLTKLKARVEAYEDALLQLGQNNGVQSYSLDTGQGKQTVTRADMSNLRRDCDAMINQVTVLENRLYGCGRHNMGAGW